MARCKLLRAAAGRRHGVRRGPAWVAVLAATLAAALGAVAPGPAAGAVLSADDAVRVALERNPAALQSGQEVQAAAGRLIAARSQIVPQLDVAGQWSKSSEESFFFPPGATSIDQAQITDESSNGSISLSQSLISFPAWGQIRAASGARDAAQMSDQATRADIALQAYQQYYALLKAYKFARVTDLSLKLRRDQLARTEALFELGSVARGDVLKQQVTVSQAELDDIAARKNIVVQEALLSAVLDLKIGVDAQIDTTLTEATFEVDSAAVMRDALAQRPELAAFRARLRSAQASLGAAQGGRYPTADASLRYDFRVPGLPNSLNEIDNYDQMAGYITLRWPLFDGLFSKGRIKEARAQQLQAEYALQQTELNVIVEVQQALQAARQALDQNRVARDGLAAAQEDLKLTQEKYNVGSATVIELIDSQVSLTRAAVQYINARADAHVAEMGLRRARGERF